MEVRNKVALVLGGSKGIGRAVARVLADSGAKLILPYHDDWPNEAEDMKKEFAQLGENLEEAVDYGWQLNSDKVMNLKYLVDKQQAYIKNLQEMHRLILT